jgi:hypothetical protein
MPQYILRDIPPAFWDRVKARALLDGWPLRPLILQLLEDYADGKLAPSARPPLQPLAIFSWMKPYYRQLAQQHPGPLLKYPEPVQWTMLRAAIARSNPPGDRTRLEAVDGISRDRHSAILKWLRESTEDESP